MRTDWFTTSQHGRAQYTHTHYLIIAIQDIGEEYKPSMNTLHVY